MPYDLESIARGFCMEGAFVGAEAYGNGHIHDTYVVARHHNGRQVRYILQRINHQVFHDPVGLMDNISRITAHIRAVLQGQGITDIHRHSLSLVPTWEHKPLYQDASGNYWRAYLFIEGATSHEVVKTQAQAYEAAKAFGEFQRYLLDFPRARLVETIPGFHNTPKRYAQFERAVAADRYGRAAQARAEIEFARRHRATTEVLLRLHEAGKIPERITHNDTKLNNVLLDEASHEGLCVIDLDTVMPGLGLYDFGDLVRSCTSPTQEDEQDLSQVVMRMPIFEALAQGYLAATRGFLTQAELDHLAFSGKLIALETGLRFLTDYLMGDIYFKTEREAHNLDRCRVQFKLVQSIEEQEDTMNQLVRKLAR